MQQTTKFKASKELIAEGTATGGLTNKDTRQHYRINYLLPTEKYEPKLELALLIIQEKEGKQIQSYRSLRFTNSAQIRMFILSMIKAYFYWQKKQEQVRPDNFNYKLQKFMENIEEVVRHPEKFR